MHIVRPSQRFFLLLYQRKKYLLVLASIIVCLYIGTYLIARHALLRYEELISVVVYDRHGIPITVAQNIKGLYTYPLTSLPKNFEEILLQKEDNYFYYHPGVNPFSALRALIHLVRDGDASGASTITQQLTKNILGTESERTFWNKVRESIYAVSLELHTSKKEILTLYANSVFLGNQIQGFETGSHVYFNKALAETEINEQLSLLATLSHPSTRNPWKEENIVYAQALHERLGTQEPYFPPLVTTAYALQHPSSFEINTAGLTCITTCTTTLDATLNEALRSILKRHVAREYDRGARNGAIVVIEPKTEKLLAFIGSPDPSNTDDGGQINMALAPRPVGSTMKPLIYLKGFMEGLRPYTKVDDREYKYPIATGFSLYPKNFDGAYHGEMTLHEALSNSFNVPSVKVLEYIGLGPFYQFLNEKLSFTPIQPYDSYQYGIALGGLEMDLLTLTHYFSIFPRMGTIAPLHTYTGDFTTPDSLPPQSQITGVTSVAEPQFTQLVHAIISDRLTGVEQFGLKSNLNLTTPFYAVKTGTSRDFHDSWVVGYTNDFVVGVWVGNSENEALTQVTGQSGAGAIWHDVMEYLAETSYYTNTPISLDKIERIPMHQSLEWGLEDEVPSNHENLLLDTRLITKPHDGDTFEYTRDTVIPLESRTPVTWSINGTILEANTPSARFTPETTGRYEISATDAVTGQTEYVRITINPQ